MAIYKMVGNKEKLDKISATSFGQEGVLERSDLQRILLLSKRLGKGNSLDKIAW